MSKYIDFHSDKETDILSFKNRTNNLYTYRNIIDGFIYRNGFDVTNDIDTFLRLKAKDADKDVISSILPSNNDDIDSEEVKIIKKTVEDQAAVEFVQLFLDKYMAPIGSDIEYRLGKVTGIKAYHYTGTSDGDKLDVKDPYSYGQYDEYGRIDTSINLRYKVDITGVTGQDIDISYSKGVKTIKVSNSSTYVIPPTEEEFVNFFFPPFRTDAFKDNASLANVADTYIKARTWDSKLKKWIYRDEELINTTFDTQRLLSLRHNPTYRNAAFKAINDNISLLQYFMEQSVGIVSTYLTEWDLSIYIQEGLLSDNSGEAPSYLTLTNRILKDNPSGFKNSNAFTYGALNAAVSKTPLGVPTPNTSIWNPSAYPLSTYWVQYDSLNRGDGLDKFYDIALKGFPKYSFNNSYTFRDKIKWGDQLGAAYSGWYNWDSMCYWQLLYTNKGDGFEHVDIVHMSEDASCDVFENTTDEDGEQIDGTIQKIIDALYDSDGDLEMAPNVGEPWTEETDFKDYRGHLVTRTEYKKYNDNPPHEVVTTKMDYYDNDDDKYIEYYNAGNDENGNTMWRVRDADTQSTSVDTEESDYKILGIRIKGSRILKLFLKKDSITDKVMGVANKESGSDYSSASSSSSGSTGNSLSGLNTSTSKKADGTTEIDISTGSDTSSADYYSDVNNGNGSGSGSRSVAKDTLLSMVDTDEKVNGQYSRPSGVSQLSPVLYGGPHGKFYSPKTVQGYFEEDSEFFRNIPRMDPNAKSSNASDNFTGLEHNYSPTYLYKENAPYRSPSSCLRSLDEGYCDYSYQLVQSLVKHYTWQDTPTGYYNGWYYHSIYIGWEPYSYNTGYRTPDSQINTDRNYHNSYGTNQYEWDNYYKYYSDPTLYRKDYWGQMWCWKSYTTYSYGYGSSSRSSYGNTWSSSYNRQSQYGYWGVYSLIGTRYRKKYYCEYQSWDNYYYKRPLMHSNPNASNDSYWNITQGCYGANLYLQVSPAPWWYSFFNFFLLRQFIRYTPAASAYHVRVATSNDQNRWRLTFPRSGVYFRNPSIYSGVYELRTNEEQRFMKYVTGNTKSEDNSHMPNDFKDWHTVTFFQSTSDSYSDRVNNGPELIFRVPVRKQVYDFAYYVTVWYCRRQLYLYWRPFRKTIKIKFLWWHWTITITIWLLWLGVRWIWYPVQEIRIGKAAWIEADMNSVQEVWSGLRQTPWSNLDTIKNSSSNQEIYSDVIPGTQAKTNLPDNPLGFLSTTNKLPSWAIPINTDGTKPFLFGWGYCTTLPGMEFTRVEQSQFEDPRDYLNLVRYYNRVTNSGTSAKNVRYMDLKFPFYSLNNNLPLRYITPNAEAHSLAVQGVKQYAEIPYLDKGLQKSLRRMYTTSTLFKYDESDLNNYMYPRIVSNDCAIRTLAKIVAHQYSWLISAQDVFVKSINFNRVVELINNTVNKTILAKSLPSNTETYNTQSIYYRYWIEKAYNIFTTESKDSINNLFTTRINALNQFLQNVKGLISKKIDEWTYNDTINAYKYINSIKSGAAFLTNQTTGRRDERLEEYMFAYLNVLYEYRKYFINKRCNKVDGTLWQMRQLEGAIPEVTTKLDDLTPFNLHMDYSPSASSQGKYKYKVSYYDVTNSNLDKTRTIIDENSTPLSKDRTMVIYIKVSYGKEQDVANFLTKCKNGTLADTDQRYIYVPENGKYAELPFDDIYRYISTEWTSNETVKLYNSKVSTSKQKKLNDEIDDSIFSIQWANKEKMNRLITANNDEKARIRKSFGDRLNFPYVYHKPDGWETRDHIRDNPPLLPMIKFDIMGGINPGKVAQLWNSTSYQISKDVISAKDIICTAGEKSDYWCIAIPISSRPRTVGYQTNLSIKSYRKETTTTSGDNVDSTASGVFGYMLYPITEEQANTIPGIGVGMSGIQAELKEQYLTQINKAIQEAQDEN